MVHTEFLHVKPGKGAAFVRTKLKNLLSNGNQEKTFRGGETVNLAEVSRREVQFTYPDGDQVRCGLHHGTRLCNVAAHQGGMARTTLARPSWRSPC